MNDPKVSVVMTIYNRADLLTKTIQTFTRQNFNFEDYELVIVDDQSTDHLSHLLETYKGRLRIQHIVMSKSLSHYKVAANCPALGLNIGFKQARGEIILKTDPEMYQVGETLSQAVGCFDPNSMVFGASYWVSEHYTKLLGKLEDEQMVGIAEEGYDDNLKPLVTPSNFAPLYFISVMPKKAILDIGGIDEQFMSGIACDDDDFAERMQVWGCTWKWDFDMIGMHQYHGPWWYEKPGQGFDSSLYQSNRAILDSRMARIGRTIFNRPPQIFEWSDADKKEFCIVNKDHDWGNAIVSQRIIE